MKTLKLFLLAVVLTFSSVVSAGTNPSKDAEPKTLNQSISELLKKPDFDLKGSTEATIQLMINNEDELIVLSVESKSETVKNFIKTRLNYKKIDRRGYGSQVFTVPVKIEVTS